MRLTLCEPVEGEHRYTRTELIYLRRQMLRFSRSMPPGLSGINIYKLRYPCGENRHGVEASELNKNPIPPSIKYLLCLQKTSAWNSK